jgi:hypothetical protein
MAISQTGMHAMAHMGAWRELHITGQAGGCGGYLGVVSDSTRKLRPSESLALRGWLASALVRIQAEIKRPVLGSMT